MTTSYRPFAGHRAVTKPGRLFEATKDNSYNPRTDDEVYLGTALLDQIEQGVIGTVDWFKDASKDQEGIGDDILRLLGGGLINTATAISYIPGIKQLGELEDWIAGQARALNEQATPWLDPRFAGWGSRIATGIATDKGIGLAGKGVQAGYNALGKALVNTIDDFTGLSSLGTGGAKAASGGGTLRSKWLKKHTKNFNYKDLLEYEEAAYQYRLSRPEGKRNLMKGFDFRGSGQPYIYDKQGNPYLLIRKKGASKLRDETTKAKLKAADPKNFALIPLEEQIDRLARDSGWTVTAKELKELKRQLNQMGPNPAFYEPLMQHGDYAYLEHKIAKGSDWFWNARNKDRSFASWLDPSITRNSEGNIRILFNESFKTLKDTVEKKIKATNKTIQAKGEKYIISLEDPMSGDFAKRSNPGNITVRRAGDGTVIGVIPDYLQEFYTTNFVENFNYKGLIDRPGNPVPEFYRVSELGETATDYINRVLKERLELILAKQFNTSALDIGENVLDDLNDFYTLFADQLGWVRRPQYIEQQILDPKNWQ